MVLVRSKNSWWNKHVIVKNNFCKREIDKLILKSLLRSSCYDINLKIYFSNLLHMYSKISSISRYRSCCGFSRFGRVVIRKFSLSRHFCKRFASNGFLTGMRKSSF